jgi:hypothetical protein
LKRERSGSLKCGLIGGRSAPGLKGSLELGVGERRDDASVVGNDASEAGATRPSLVSFAIDVLEKCNLTRAVNVARSATKDRFLEIRAVGVIRCLRASFGAKV